MAQVNPNTNTASFAINQIGLSAVLTLADTVADDTPSNTEIIVVSSSKGSLVTSISAMPRATLSDTSLHLFVSDDGGTTKRLVSSALMSAHTVSAATKIPVTAFVNENGTIISDSSPFRLGADEELYVGAGVALAGGIVVKSVKVDF